MLEPCICSLPLGSMGLVVGFTAVVASSALGGAAGAAARASSGCRSAVRQRRQTVVGSGVWLSAAGREGVVVFGARRVASFAQASRGSSASGSWCRAARRGQVGTRRETDRSQPSRIAAATQLGRVARFRALALRRGARGVLGGACRQVAVRGVPGAAVLAAGGPTAAAPDGPSTGAPPGTKRRKEAPQGTR